jgi:hypothetical protein
VPRPRQTRSVYTSADKQQCYKLIDRKTRERLSSINGAPQRCLCDGLSGIHGGARHNQSGGGAATGNGISQIFSAVDRDAAYGFGSLIKCKTAVRLR